MNCTVCLSLKRTERVRKALAQGSESVVALSVSQWLLTEKQTIPDVMIVDPGVLATNATILPACERLILYLEKDVPPRAIAPFLASARVYSVILSEYDDSHEDLRTRLASLDRPSYGAQVLGQLLPRLEMVPPKVRFAVFAVFSDVRNTCCSKQLAAEINISRRSLDRHLRAVGLAPISRFVAAGQLLRTYAFLADKQSTVYTAAQKTGYMTVKAFRAHCKAFAGLRPRDIITTGNATPSELVRRVGASLSLNPISQS